MIQKLVDLWVHKWHFNQSIFFVTAIHLNKDDNLSSALLLFLSACFYQCNVSAFIIDGKISPTMIFNG